MIEDNLRSCISKRDSLCVSVCVVYLCVNQVGDFVLYTIFK